MFFSVWHAIWCLKISTFVLIKVLLTYLSNSCRLIKPNMVFFGQSVLSRSLNTYKRLSCPQLLLSTFYVIKLVSSSQLLLFTFYVIYMVHHIIMYPLYTIHTTLAPLSKHLLLSLSRNTSCIIPVPGLLICPTVETSVDRFGHRRNHIHKILYLSP